MVNTIFKVIIFLSIIRNVHSQNESDISLWNQIRIDGKIQNVFTLGDKKYEIWHSTEFHHRLKNNLSNFSQIILRPMLGFEVVNNMIIWSGIAYIESEINGELTQEIRPFQLITYNLSPTEKNYRFLLGTRLEQRFIHDEKEMAIRVRQLLKVNFDFYKKNDNTLSIFFQEEVFFRLNDTKWGGSSGFDQNRIWTGIEYIKDHPQIRYTIGLGYNRQYFTQGVNHGLHLLIRIGLK